MVMMKIHVAMVVFLLFFSCGIVTGAPAEEENSSLTQYENITAGDAPPVVMDCPGGYPDGDESFADGQDAGLTIEPDTPYLGPLDVRYVGADSIVFTWNRVSGCLYIVYRSGFMIGGVDKDGECKFRYTCPASDRNITYEYMVVAIDAQEREVGYYAKEIASGRAFGNLAEYNYEDIWAGGSVMLIDDVDLGGNTLWIMETEVTGSINADTGMATAISGNGNILSYGSVFRNADLQVHTPSNGYSCLNSIGASNSYISIIGNKTEVVSSFFTGERGILRLNGDLIVVRGNQFWNIGNGLEVEGACCAISGNLFSGWNGTASADGIAITVSSEGGGISNNAIAEFKRAMEISGDVSISDNVIINITSDRQGTSVVQFYNAEGSVFEKNTIVGTDQPKAQAVLTLTDTGKVTIQNNTITGGIQGVKLSNTNGGNVIANNNITDMTYYGISLHNAAPTHIGIEQAGMITGNVIKGSGSIAGGVGCGILIDNYHPTLIMENIVMDFYDAIVIRASNDTWVFSNTLLPVTGHGIAIYKKQTLYPFSEGAERSFVRKNSIGGGSTGILVEGRDSLIIDNDVLGYTRTGIQIDYGDQNIVRDNFLLSVVGDPVDIRIGTRPDTFPEDLVLESNTLARDMFGKNMATFSLSDLTEGVTIRAVNAPPKPPEKPDYSFGMADIGQWLSIQSGNFTNQEDVSLNLTFHYEPGELKGVIEESLMVWRYNGTRWDAGGGDPPWNGTRWFNTTTHEIGVQVQQLLPWNVGTAVFAPLGCPFRADFTASPTRGPAPLTVRFTDLSEGGPESWQWNFGDGNTSTEQNPAYTYVSPGNYTVTLTASNAGESDTLTRSGYIEVESPPLPEVTGIFPAYGYSNGTLIRATVTGTGFDTGASVKLIEDDRPGINATNITVASPPEITCTISLAGIEPGNRTVRVTNPGGGSGMLADGFRVRLRGDFNGVGNVDIGDVAKVAYMVVGKEPGNPEADFNGNSQVDIGDASKIAYYFVEKVPVL